MSLASLIWFLSLVAALLAVTLNLTQWPRKRLDRLQELAEADFARRQTEASSPCGEHPFHLSLYEFASGAPAKFVATYKAADGQVWQYRFGFGSKARLLLREQFAAQARDPELDLTWPDVWKIERYMQQSIFCIAQQKAELHFGQFVKETLGKIHKAINDERGDAA